jgi:hypothetical protein
MMIEVIAVNNPGLDSLPEVCFKPVVDGLELNAIAESEEVAYLLGLERKYQGLNSQFTKFACRMLGIESAWAK